MSKRQLNDVPLFLDDVGKKTARDERFGPTGLPVGSAVLTSSVSGHTTDQKIIPNLSRRQRFPITDVCTEDIRPPTESPLCSFLHLNQSL